MKKKIWSQRETSRERDHSYRPRSSPQHQRQGTRFQKQYAYATPVSVSDFEIAHLAWEERRFGDALDAFNALAIARPDDAVVARYCSVCRAYRGPTASNVEWHLRR